MLQLPNEVLSMIIDHAMTRDDPLFLDYLLQNPYPVEKARRRADYLPDKDIETAARRERKVYTSWPNPDQFYLSPSQRPHLQDWCFINSTCRLLRTLGKPAFFARKTFVLSPELADKFRNSRLRGLSKEDQQLARRCFTSLVFAIGDYFFVPKSVLSLPRRLEIFPRVTRVDYLPCRDPCDRPEAYLESIRRRKPPACFVECLRLMGIDAKTLDVGIMVDSDDHFRRCENNILTGIYPLLKHVWTIKARETSSGMAS
ncbi:hypothetical protein AJ79_09400 [Helicocarpus griseus UAMH5409]|uniref:Uncharacterized protein n=1 Tax=Helicocarpus griseus UAMH5409 TaxID=1447875 RepID=A0A2B7WK87_9EURO|nr:hypothetical protein AJ79_09400 [Helicocarpus griseus UAMH5409]